MPDDYEDRFAPPSQILAYLAIPAYYTSVVVHRLFGAAEDHRLAAWESRIRYRYFLQGLPALAGLTAAVVVAFLAWRNSAQAETTYARRASASVVQKDFAAAEVYYTRLLGMRPNDSRYRFGLGIAASERNDAPRAAQLIGPLAPDDRFGYPAAHLWTVEQLLRQSESADLPTRERLAAAEKHLIRLRGDPELGPQARLMLMRLYVSTGQMGLVLDDPELRREAERLPETRLAVVQELALRGRQGETQLMLDALIRDFTAAVRADRDDHADRVMLCKSLALSGDLRTAVATAEEGLKLAPDGPFGALLVDLLTARAAQVRTADGLTEGERREAYRRAVAVTRQYGRDTTADNLKIAELSRWLGDDAEVERRYTMAAEQLPLARVQLAEFYGAVGRADDAVAQWQRIEQRFEQLSPEQQANPAERIMAATALLRRGRYEAAEQLLQADASNPNFVALQSSIYGAWYDALAAKSQETPDAAITAERLALLRKAFLQDPWNPALLQRLLQLSRQDSAVSAEISQFLLGLIVEGKTPASAYLLLGTDALQHGDRTTAMEYLDHAYRLRPDAVDVMNNLAWAWLTAEKPDVERALELATAAHRKAPKDTRVLDTRFRAYARLGRWPEALADLEACTAAMTGNRDFHEAAAEVYEHLNQPSVAAEHRRRAASAKPQ